ncbi:hypothetical protein ACFSTI_18340 [Rhizorhabdus histidinilytica]
MDAQISSGGSHFSNGRLYSRCLGGAHSLALAAADIPDALANAMADLLPIKSGNNFKSAYPVLSSPNTPTVLATRLRDQSLQFLSYQAPEKIIAAYSLIGSAGFSRRSPLYGRDQEQLPMRSSVGLPVTLSGGTRLLTKAIMNPAERSDKCSRNMQMTAPNLSRT